MIQVEDHGADTRPGQSIMDLPQIHRLDLESGQLSGLPDLGKKDQVLDGGENHITPAFLSSSSI